jgi:hypothetical protein
MPDDDVTGPDSGSVSIAAPTSAAGKTVSDLLKHRNSGTTAPGALSGRE